MFSLDDFNKIVYRKPYSTKSVRYIKDVAGFDTEAYQDGKPFMFCTSKGETFKYGDIPEKLFTSKYNYKHFVVYNLTYDSGAITYHLPEDNLIELKDLEETEYNGYKYFYIPRKLLKISNGKRCIYFWDLFQFYGMSLNTASEKYLGMKKIDIDVKKFTKEYVKHHWKEIEKYCIRDCILTEKLAKFFFKKLKEFDIRPSNLYSPASISFKYIKEKYGIVDVWLFWKHYKDLLYYACSSYRGGKFEIYVRGKFYGYEYDIISAYPYEVSKLLSTRYCKLIVSKDYQRNCDYGFLRVIIDNKDFEAHPISIKKNNVNIYPLGKYKTYITKQEYDYLVKNGVKVKILSGYWLRFTERIYPYRKAMYDLYKLKEFYKGKDEFMYHISKMLLNSFYGKMVQLIPDSDGSIVAGQGWHPIYASIVTANVRIRMCELHRILGKDCIAIHTDSIITTRKLPESMLGNKMGDLELKCEGEGIMINSGIYQIGDKVTYRGLPLTRSFSWYKTLNRYKDEDYVKIPNFIIQSWLEAVHRRKFEDRNKPIYEYKKMFLNGFTKRNFIHHSTGEDLLNTIEYSLPNIYVDI